MKKSSPLGRFQDHAEWGCIPQQPTTTCVNISRKSNKLGLKFLHSQPADHRERSRKPNQLMKRKQHSTRKAKGVSNWLMQLTFTFWVSLSRFHGHYFHLTAAVRVQPHSQKEYPAQDGGLSVTMKDLRVYPACG